MSKGLYRNYTYPSQMRKCNWEMVAVQELHPSVVTAAHQMLKTKNAGKRKRKSLWRSSAAESLGRLFEAGSHSSLSFDFQKYLRKYKSQS
jgi:hypothetical protein